MPEKSPEAQKVRRAPEKALAQVQVLDCVQVVRGSDPRTLQQASSQDRLVESMATLVQGHSVCLQRSGCYRLGLTI